MNITERHITVRELVENYRDIGDDGVFGYNNRLAIRPAYQREFIYKDKQRNAVIDTVMKGYPLNVMYWSKVGDDQYEVLDGQQRTISVAQYVSGAFSIPVNGNDRFFHNLDDAARDQILDYELTIYVCEGSEIEKLEWFKVINIAGEVLTSQELLNATYVGPWLADAKRFFSKRGCVAGEIAKDFVKGNPIRQELLEKALSWIADRDGLPSGERYMAIHQHDKDADDPWQYYQMVINWAQRLFKGQKGLTDNQEWGILYNKYHDRTYNSNALDSDLKRLLMDDDVTKKQGIIHYILSDRLRSDERYLSIRTFTESQKRRAYEKQGHKCPMCLLQGIDTEYAFEEMQGDHITPWSKGGRTIDDNLQMLCARCNSEKSAK